MDHTAGPILEIGVLLLGAVVAGLGSPGGSACRRSSATSPSGSSSRRSRPGYVADHDQLQLLADLGVVLLLFEVGIEVDLLRIRSEQRGPDRRRAAPDGPHDGDRRGSSCSSPASQPIPAALIGLSIALSSSVVIVNITKSRRRTTDRATEQALLGWSALQDTHRRRDRGRPAGPPRRRRAAARPGGDRAGRVPRPGRRGRPAPADRPARPPLRARPVPHRVGRERASPSPASAPRRSACPLALAAFVGGLAVTESPEAAEARRRLLPFRDLFAVLFFVAIGTLIQPDALVRGLRWLGLFLVLIVVAKVAVAYGLARAARLPARPLQLAIGLGQVGEFSFVLGSAAVAAGAITQRDLRRPHRRGRAEHRASARSRSASSATAAPTQSRSGAARPDPQAGPSAICRRRGRARSST